MKAEEKAIYLFNKALKKLALFNLEQSKKNAKEIVLMELVNIKEAFFDLQQMDDIPLMHMKKTWNHYQKVQTIIEKL
jgi:hypothetical protein